MSLNKTLHPLVNNGSDQERPRDGINVELNAKRQFKQTKTEFTNQKVI